MGFLRKIYFPGLVSILGISALFFFKWLYTDKYVCIEATLPSHSSISCYSSDGEELKFLATNYFIIEGKNKLSKKIIELGFDTLASIIKRKDSTRNIAFDTKAALYGDIINIYNHCLIHGINNFTSNRDTLFVLHTRFKVNEPEADVWQISGKRSEYDGLLPRLIPATPRPLF